MPGRSGLMVLGHVGGIVLIAVTLIFCPLLLYLVVILHHVLIVVIVHCTQPNHDLTISVMHAWPHVDRHW